MESVQQQPRRPVAMVVLLSDGFLADVGVRGALVDVVAHAPVPGEPVLAGAGVIVLEVGADGVCLAGVEVVVGALVLAFLGRRDVGDAFKVPETAVRRLKAETI